MKHICNKTLAALAFSLLAITGCMDAPRMGMIKDPLTGIQYGSVVGKSFFIDSEQFPNKVVKISARNVSGDVNYNIRRFEDDLRSAFESKGYEAYKNAGFGLKIDVVVEYSGHIQENMSATLGLLGAGVGAVSGRHSDAMAAEGIGLVAGATLGAIAGSYITDDTYIMIANVTIGIMDSETGKTVKTISFSSSPKLQEEEDDGFKRFKEVGSTNIAVFAGGRNVSQGEVIQEVRQRLIRIVSDII